MGANQRWHGLGGVASIPAGLILGLKPGASPPADWSVWSSADGRFLKGTSSDTTINTTANANSISYTSGNGGSHVGSTGYVSWYGYSGTGSNENSPSADLSSQGNHYHSVVASHTPTSNRFKLVQAGAGAKLVAGLVGFSTEDLVKHIPYTDFDGSSGYLQANTATGTGAASSSAYLNSASDYHDHVSSNTTSSNSTLAGSYTSSGGGGGSHPHSVTSPSISASLAQTLVRAFEVLDISDIDGLIGIWVSTGAIPDGWELADQLTDRYLRFSATGNGAQSGNNTMTVSATSGYSSHGSHLSGWSSSYDEAADVPHNSTESHRHSASGSGSYQPNRYHVKFIRKLS